MPFQSSLAICPICQKEEEFKFIRDYQNRDGQFSLYECLKCGLQFWNPFQNPGKEWYEKEYDYQARNILISKSYRTCHKKFLKIFKDVPAKTKILDIGCGMGEFLAELQARGAEVWGVDFNKNFTNIAQNKFDLKNIYTMDFDAFLEKENIPRFDIVTFFGVLEHVDNPWGLVQGIKNIIKPDGVIATSAPCKENLVSGMNSRDLPPDHLSQWNQKAITSLFQKIGFAVSRLEYLDQFQSFRSVITEKFRFGLVDKTARALNSGNERRNGFVLLKIIHILGSLKDFLIGGLPAGFLWIVSKLLGRRGATMFVILKKS